MAELSGPKEEIYVYILTLLGIFSALKSLKKLKKNLGRKGIFPIPTPKVDLGFCSRYLNWVSVLDNLTGFRFLIPKPSFGHRLALSSQ